MMKHLQQSVLEGSAGPVLKAARRREGKELRFFFFPFSPFTENNVKPLLSA